MMFNCGGPVGCMAGWSLMGFWRPLEAFEGLQLCATIAITAWVLVGGGRCMRQQTIHNPPGNSPRHELLSVAINSRIAQSLKCRLANGVKGGLRKKFGKRQLQRTILSRTIYSPPKNPRQTQGDNGTQNDSSQDNGKPLAVSL